MTSRRQMLQVAAAAGALLAAYGPARGQGLSRSVREEDLLRFRGKGQLTLLHMTDCHAQLKPIYYREPAVNLGVGAARGEPPHLTDREFLTRFAVDAGSWRAYALTSTDFELLARAWGRVGGMDRMARLVGAIRAERGADRVLFLDGGDALQGSFTALDSRGGDMVRVLEALGVEATTGHWEFTLGAERITELFGSRDAPGSARMAFLAGNVVESDFEEPAFRAWRLFEKGGVGVAVIGQAFPYTPIANPAWKIPQWSMGIREKALRASIAEARAAGAQVVVLLSHNGFDVDRKLAARIPGIDVILSGHTHDALPQPVLVGRTILVASGSHGKFLTRLDLDVRDGRVADFAHALIPVLADAVPPDPAMAALIAGIRAPHEAMLQTRLATTDTMLYRRDNFGGTLDDVIGDAMLAERDAEIAFSPGFRWGGALLAGQPITWDDVYNATAITYPACYLTHFTGAQIRDILEDVADNVFNPDPYYQQGGDMVRVAGLAYDIDVSAPMGRRITRMQLQRNGEAIEASRRYRVAGWGATRRDAHGPPIWNVVAAHLKRLGTVAVKPRHAVRVRQAALSQLPGR